MADDRNSPPVNTSVNYDPVWLREVYGLVDPRSKQVTRESLARAFHGLDVAHLRLVRDLNSVILETRIEAVGGCPDSYEEISLYTDHIVIDSFLTELIGDAGTNPAVGTPEISHSGRRSRVQGELHRGFTELGRVQKARQIKRKGRFRHYASKLWRKPSIRRPLKVLLVIFALAASEQSIERYAPEPVGRETRKARREAIHLLGEAIVFVMEWLIEPPAPSPRRS